MIKLVSAALMLLVASTAAAQRVQMLTTLADTTSIRTYYRQSVYDPSDQKIGQIVDLLIDKEGQTQVAMVSVGGFLGLASKYVALPFKAIQALDREHKPYLVVDTTRRDLRDAPAFRYDRSRRTWRPAQEE